MTLVSMIKTFFSSRRNPIVVFVRAAITRFQGYLSAKRVGASLERHQEALALAWPAEGSNSFKEYFDSVTTGHGIFKWEHYFEIFKRHLEKFKNREVHILEVGIYSGGSLEMWKACFGPKCHVYGLDIEPHCQAYESERIKVFIGSQGDALYLDELKRKIPKLDIVVDDGSHRPAHQILTLQKLLPHLRAGGVYICEDVHGGTNPFMTFMQGLSRGLNDSHPVSIPGSGDIKSETTSFQKHIKSICFYPFATVVERTESPVNELMAFRHGTQWKPPGA